VGIRDSRQDLHRLAIIATSRQGMSPSPNVVFPNPKMLVSGRSIVSGEVFCLQKCPKMMDRVLGFRWRPASRNHHACVPPLHLLSSASVIVVSSRTCLRHCCLGYCHRSGCTETMFDYPAHVSHEHGERVTHTLKTVRCLPSVLGPVSSRMHI
jgi:hypothetical protein